MQMVLLGVETASNMARSILHFSIIHYFLVWLVSRTVPIELDRKIENKTQSK